MSVAEPDVISEVDELEALFNMPAFQHGYCVVVWDDDVNTIDYVIMVFMVHFKLSEEEAIQRTFEVHEEGKSVLAHGTRDEMLVHKRILNEKYKLQATVEEL